MSRRITKKEGIKLATVAAIFIVTSALITLPYQNQVANAAPPLTKKYQVYVTLVGVPANAGDLIVNGTLDRNNFDEEIVSSPTNVDTVKLVITGPRDNLVNLIICATQLANDDINNCSIHSLPSKVSGPIRVDHTYPQ